MKHYAEKIRPMVCDTVTYMHKALQNESANIVVEGANALMLDIDFGKFLWNFFFFSKICISIEEETQTLRQHSLIDSP